jgi:hypothetical protein
MASWAEIERVRKDPTAVRRLAKFLLNLLKLSHVEFTDWEIDFLEGMARRDAEQELTTRQSEKLLQIRDDAEVISEFRGFSVRSLLRRCHDARLDLAEGDEEWVVEMFERSQSTIKRKQVGRLMRCARELQIIEDDLAA